MIVYIDNNRKLVEEFITERLPMIKVFPLEGTYLMWMDFSALGMEAEELECFMKEKALWFTDEGYIFGDSGRGYERIVIACPRWVLKEALERLADAVETLNVG